MTSLPKFRLLVETAGACTKAGFAAAAWLTVNGWLAIAIVAWRAGPVLAAMVYATWPLPLPEAGMTVTHGCGDEAVHAQPAAVVMLTAAIAPAAGAPIALVGLSEIAQDPLPLESTASVSLRTSPKSPEPWARMRPVRLTVLWPMVTGKAPITTRCSDGTEEVSGTSPWLVCRSTPPLDVDAGSHVASPVLTSVGVIWHVTPDGICTCAPFSTVISRLGQTI